MKWWQRLIRRRKTGVVAVMAGLMAPVLIGFAALSIDGGYWIGSQDALQSQANAGAISAMRSENYGLTSSAAISEVSSRAALGANSSMPKAAIQTSLGPGSATVTARNGAPVYLARVLGVTGFTLGASATAGGASVNHAITGCLIAFSTSASKSIYVEGGATITTSNCGVISNSSASSNTNGDSNAIVADPSGSITAPQVLSVGGIYADTNGGAYIGAAAGQPSIVTPNGKPASDPLAAMGDPPSVPPMPSMPANGATTNIASSGEKFGYVAPWSKPWGGCTGSYTADCYLNAGSFDGLPPSGISIMSFTLNTGSATPNNASLYTVSGQISLSGGSNSTPLNFDAGTYFLHGDVQNGVVSDPALVTNVKNITVADGSTFYVDGGLDLSGSSPIVNFGKGFYYFSNLNNSSDCLSNANDCAFYSNSESVNFAGGTYIFNGSVYIGANTNVTFGPGIYIISNGTFTVTAGTTITANGATFVLENGASYNFGGAATGYDLSAPTSNCVKPADYPLAAYTGTFPYDGTNGEGICGVLFYQARNDSAPDTFSGSAAIGINGIIYTRSADLTLPGATVIKPSSSTADAGLLVNTVQLTGSGSINLQAAAGSPLTNVNFPSSEPILTK